MLASEPNHRLGTTATFTLTNQSPTAASYLLIEEPAPKPVVTPVGRTLTVKGSKVATTLRCTYAACHGSVRFELRETTTNGKATTRNRAHSRLVIVSLSTGVSYSLGVNKQSVLDVTLNATALNRLALS